MAAPAEPAVKLSSAALTGIVAIIGLMAAGIFGYILFLSNLPGDLRLWWTGLVAFAFAFTAFLAYGGTRAKTLQKLAGGLFLVGTGSFYGSIVTSSWSDLLKLVWFVVLSTVVVAVLGGVYYMARESEADRVRAAERRLTP